MNKKTQTIIGIGLASLCVATFGIVFTQNNTSSSFQSLNVSYGRTTATSEGLFGETNPGAIHPENVFYVADYSDVQGYIANGNNVWVKFWTEGGVVEYVNLGSTYFTDSSNKKMLSGVVPSITSGSETVWQGFQSARVNTDFTITNEADWGNGTHVWNKSGAFTISGSNDCIAIENNDFSNTYQKCIGTGEMLRVLAWSQDWSHPVATGKPDTTHLCNGSDLDEEGLAALQTQWAASGTAFLSLTPDVQYDFSSVVGVADPDSYWQPTTAGFAARYDFIYSKYANGYGITLANWADREIN